MEPILKSHFAKFKKTFEMEGDGTPAKESKAFEHFVNYVLFSLDYADIFTADTELLDVVSVGGGDDIIGSCQPSLAEVSNDATPDRWLLQMSSMWQCFSHRTVDESNFHPHLHAVITDDCFSREGTFQPISEVNTQKMMELFRHQVFKMLLVKEKITETHVQKLLAGKHTGFSV